MYLQALHTANPPLCLRQEECWEIVDRSPVRSRLRQRSLHLLRKVLLGKNGIERRHFAIPEIERIFDLDPDSLNEHFRREAPRLALHAISPALEKAGWKAAELDALLVCTCTGYLCPGISSYLSESLGMQPHAFLQDLVGLGCGAAIPMLRAAEALVRAYPHARVACVAVEICSAAFCLDDDPGVLISACLFGDGAAATLWSGEPPSHGKTGRISNFQTLHVPEWRDRLRFETRGGRLRNLLHREVPNLAAQAVRQLWQEAGLSGDEVVLAHPGGRDVLEALAEVLPSRGLENSARVLQNFGNMSSPSVLFALQDHLASATPDSPDTTLWLTAFGAGFSAHACQMNASPQ